MLSYQHIYHAGNLADVHKHAALAWSLQYMTQKPKPFSYLETHAGRGLYHLDAAEARKTCEAAQGIAKVEGWFAPDHPYRKAIAAIRDQHGPDAYPGSPVIADAILRPGDRMSLAELHPQEVKALRAAIPFARVEQRDGCEMLRALCPPDPRRGLCLIDPSYEVKDDYRTLPPVIARTHRVWAVGCIILWYPILEGAAHVPMLATLEEALPDGLRHEVRFPPARPGHRMTGSGLFVVNPPYGLDAELARLSGHFATLAPQE